MLDNDVINQYDGLIFDMDGTVIDTMPSHAKEREMVGQRFGRKQPYRCICFRTTPHP